MAVLGVDPGSGKGLGWALLRSDLTLIDSGVIFTPSMDPDDRTPLWGELDRLLNNNAHRFTAVAYERVHRHSGIHAAHMYGGQVALIQHWCATSAKPWITVQVATVKRFLQCRAVGKAKEQAMVTAAHNLGYNSVTDHNEADAVGIALAGLDQWKTGHNVFGT